LGDADSSHQAQQRCRPVALSRSDECGFVPLTVAQIGGPLPDLDKHVRHRAGAAHHRADGSGFVAFAVRTPAGLQAGQASYSEPDCMTLIA